MFETSGIINETLLREMGKDLLPRRRRLLFIAVVIAAVLSMCGKPQRLYSAYQGLAVPPGVFKSGLSDRRAFLDFLDAKPARIKRKL